ncbi:hypothetical protein [Arsukibacterium sp.]|uniref:hypothetical protein n=1 Tax=Arsukibacterium sp. TaxID=1977258 RepID=UPI00299EA9EC|nr:hypothetical protein [Arsukibacterium sp.]MDX1678967.1 hypothetical protein [Arsukibacterium sp.]
MLDFRLYLVSCTALFCAGALASVQWDGQLNAGVLSSNNLSVIELEQISEQSDQALTLDALLNLQWQPSSNSYVDMGASYHNRRFQTLEEYNLQLQSIYLDTSYVFMPLTLGLNYQHSNAQLAGQTFLNQQQVGVYASKVLRRQWYVRAGLTATDKTFKQFPERNAENLALQLDLYWFARNRQNVVALSYAHTNEDSDNLRYSYNANRVDLQFTKQLTFNSTEHKLRLGGRAEQRRYQHFFDSSASSRDDNQLGLDASLQFFINRHLSLLIATEWVNTSSNLKDAAYQETSYSLSLRLNF